MDMILDHKPVRSLPTSNRSSSRADEENFTFDQLLCVVSLGLLLVAAAYITAALFVYGRRMTKSIRAARRPSQERARPDCLLNNAQILLSFAALLALFRFAMEIAEVRYGRRDGELVCTLLNGANTVMMSASLTSVYLVLWLRQRKFNNNLPMNGVARTVHRLFSGLVLFLVVASATVTLVIYLGLRSYRGSELHGCVFQWRIEGGHDYIQVAVGFVCTLVLQLMLLALLVFPLLRHRKSLERMSSSQHSHLVVMQRLTVCAFCAILVNPCEVC